MYIREHSYRALGEPAALFHGVFTGEILGDANTKASVTFTSTQSGNSVTGTIEMGSGLQLDFKGTCGLEMVDTRKFSIRGTTDPTNPLHLTTTTQVKEPTRKVGIDIIVFTDLTIDALLENQGATIVAKITLMPVRSEPKTPMVLCKSVTRTVKLTKQASPAPSLQGFGQAPALTPGHWQDLISFVPPANIQRKILSQNRLRPWFFHRIEDAVGPVNLDYYPVLVSRLPKVGGTALSPSGFQALIRSSINNFIDKRLLQFTPRGAGEAALWSSPNPLGAIMHLDFYRVMGIVPRFLTNVDDGTVVVSDFTANHWRVYTVWTPTDHGHPVSGVREWGWKSEGTNYIYYTRAADSTDQVDAPPVQGGHLRGTGHALAELPTGSRGIRADQWRPGHGVLPPTATRYDWAPVAGQHHRPTTAWITS